MSTPGEPGYWERRRGLRYYEEVVELARRHVPSGGAALDVGSHQTEVLERLDWFERRVALDVRMTEPRPRIETVVSDFMEYEVGEGFDLVLCLQVLEHVREPAAFARKLLGTGRTVIISVPYLWQPGWSEDHEHDPVDEAKLGAWTGREPLETALVANGLQRLIAVYREGGEVGG